MIIIASDPGLTTGVAEYDSSSAAPLNTFQLGVEEYFDYLANRVRDEAQRCLIDGVDLDVRLVVESFIITVNTAKNTQAGWSLELIGVNKFIAHRFGLKPPTLQSPSVAKTFAPDGKLKHVGWYRPGKGHANDAARHLMTYAAQRKLIFDVETLKELATL